VGAADSADSKGGGGEKVGGLGWVGDPSGDATLIPGSGPLEGTLNKQEQGTGLDMDFLHVLRNRLRRSVGQGESGHKGGGVSQGPRLGGTAGIGERLEQVRPVR
jgi:hypothetical protein